MVNKAVILEVADAIEASSIPDLGFNMRNYGAPPKYTVNGNRHPKAEDPFDCKTVACIAGWTVAVHEGVEAFNDTVAAHEIVSQISIPMKAKIILGISDEQASELFLAKNYISDNLDDISVEHAVAVLRHLAETGKVDWNKWEEEEQ